MLFEQLLGEGYVPNAAIFIDGATEFRKDNPQFTELLTKFMRKPDRLLEITLYDYLSYSR